MTTPSKEAILLEHIRFDIDYNCLVSRETSPTQGTINRELANRLKQAERKGQPIFPVGMRLRVFNTLGLKADPENHAVFDTALIEFKTRLATFEENTNQDYSGTGVVILD